MAFRSITHIRDRHYLYEKESYRDPKTGRSKQRVIRYLGPCDVKGNLLATPKPRIDSVHSAFPVGDLAVFYAGAKELKIAHHARATLVVDEHVAFLLVVQVLNQLTGRVANRRLGDLLRASPLPQWEGVDASEVDHGDFEKVEDALCRFNAFRAKEDRGLALQEALNREWRRGSREPAAVYYDITKQPYYGSTCPYAGVGHDAQGGLSPVVGFGLVVSREHHHPLLCRALPGPQNDTLSVKEIVATLGGLGYEHIVVVVDRGMVSAENLKIVRTAGDHLLGIVRGEPKGAYEALGRWTEEELERPEHLVRRNSGGVLYARTWDGSLMGQSLRLAVVVDPDRKGEERKGRDQLLQELEEAPGKERMRELRQKLARVVVKARGRRGFRVDPGKWAAERRRDGRMLMFSTDPRMTAAKMVQVYFERDAVEKVFRTGKGRLSLGPVRYRQENRVDAYATVLYLAFLLWSWSERKLRQKFPRMSLEEALHIVERVSWVRVGSGKTVREFVTRLSDEQKEILGALGAKPLLRVT
ncbi:MAG: IS1634 family transposase [Thermoplasmata archaeon]